MEDVVLDEVFDLKMDLSKKEGEAITISYKVNEKLVNNFIRRGDRFEPWPNPRHK